MLARGAPPDHFTVSPVLRSCALTGSAAIAASSHALSVKIGTHGNPFVGSALVLCFTGLSDLPDARRLFDGMRARDAVLWMSMLFVYAQGGLSEAALRFFEGMVAAGVQLDAVVLVSLLLACGQLGWRRHGRSVHACCVRRFLGMPLSLGNALVDMYVKCGEFAFAERVFATVSGEGRKEEGTMFTARRKIQKVKGLVPVEFEDFIAQAFFDLEIGNQELKSVLKGLYINSAFQMDVAGSKKAVVFCVSCRLRKAFRKFHVRLFRCIAVGLIRGSCPWICSVVALKRRIMVSTVADIVGFGSSWSSRVAMPWP